MARVAHIHRVFGGFITGKLMDSSIIGVLCFIGMRLMISFGWMTMPTSYALLIAVIIGVTNIIPFFGPFIRCDSEHHSDHGHQSGAGAVFRHFCAAAAAV